MCMAAGTFVPCDEITKQSICNNQPCFWNRDVNACEEHHEENMEDPGGGNSDPAKDLAGEAPPHGASEPDNLMDYEEEPDEPLPDCSSATCDNEPTSCGDGEIIGKHTYECCKRCGWDARSCDKFSDPETCPGKCEWHKKLYFCGGLGEPVPCEKHFEEDKCRAIENNRCEWHEEAYYCGIAGEGIPCDKTYSEDDCSKNHDCQWHDNIGTCWSRHDMVPCDKFFEEPHCKANEGDEGMCEWHAEASTCINPGQVIECPSFYTEEGCASSGERCVWLAETYTCLDASGKIPCSALKEGKCGAAEGCQWDSHFEHCEDDFDFEPLPCHEHSDEVGCTKEDGCSWHGPAHSCHKDGESVSCDKFYEEHSCKNEDDCTWNPEANICHASGTMLDCEVFYEGESCKLQSNCEWAAKQYICKEKGTKVPCDRHYEQAECASSDCSWEAKLQVCHDEKVGIPCDRYYDEEWCSEVAGCVYNADAERCHAEDETIECNSYMKEDGCTHSNCQWVEGQCHEMDHDFCGAFYDKDTCNADATCGWQTKSSRCRKLRVKAEL